MLNTFNYCFAWPVSLFSLDVTLLCKYKNKLSDRLFAYGLKASKRMYFKFNLYNIYS